MNDTTYHIFVVSRLYLQRTRKEKERSRCLVQPSTWTERKNVCRFFSVHLSKRKGAVHHKTSLFAQPNENTFSDPNVDSAKGSYLIIS
jgi:hypothetical protein